MMEEVEFGSRVIRFHLLYANRKSLGIVVTPEMQVQVKAPFNTPIETIKEKVRKKTPWILKQLDHFLSFQPKIPPRRFINGETHLYLGRQYRLQIQIERTESVQLVGPFIRVTVRENARVPEVLHEWYLRQARTKFETIAEPLIRRFKKYEVQPSSIILRSMPTRWGSCTPQGKIILNPELIKAAKGCIEYVIIHELCHLVHRNHTPKFFELQHREMRDWLKWKTKLEMLLA